MQRESERCLIRDKHIKQNLLTVVFVFIFIFFFPPRLAGGTVEEGAAACSIILLWQTSAAERHQCDHAFASTVI